MRLAYALTIAFAVGLGPSVSSAEEPPLKNGDFAAWERGLPAGWDTNIGARRDGAVRPSYVEKLEGGGVRIRGDALTNPWLMLSQDLETAPGKYLRLEFTARSAGMKKEPGQFGSSYVGLLFRDAKGKILKFGIQDVRHEDWRTEKVHERVPDGTASTEAALFLSQTGKLEVRSVSVHRLEPRDSFQVLYDDMDRNYSFFAPHEIDWKALAAAHRKKAEAAATPAAFAEAVLPMLAQLKDEHVRMDVPGRKQPVFTHVFKGQRNFEQTQMAKRLKTGRQVIPNVLSGVTRDGFGYLVIGTMQASHDEWMKVDEALRAHFKRPGLILDLRVNGGGDEKWGGQLCACLTDKPVMYARSKWRNGPGHDDFRTGSDRYFYPRRESYYEEPVVALIGPGCVSSGEGMALMLKAMPHVKLVGLPTRGASGFPKPVFLPNGVAVHYSRWISLTPKGSMFERSGVLPDVRVEHVKGEDPAFDKAIEILKKEIARRKRAAK